MATSRKKRLTVDTNVRPDLAEGRDFTHDFREALREWRGGPVHPFTRPARRLIPGAELNDGLLLTECALGQIPLLASSAKYLLDMDQDALR